MKIKNKEVLISATDLANQLACKHLSCLNYAYVNGEIEAPKYSEPLLELLMERGL